jgi:hypothetical protein
LGVARRRAEAEIARRQANEGGCREEESREERGSEMTDEDIGYLAGLAVGAALGVIVVILIVRWAKKAAKKKGSAK